MLADDATRDRLARFVRHVSEAREVRIERLVRMSGGAVQQNWALDAELAGGRLPGAHRWVLRIDAPAAVPESLTRAQEFAVLAVMHDAAVPAPRPLWLCEDSDVAGSPFFLMERLPGVAAGHRLVRESAFVPDHAQLARDLATALARIHGVPPDHSRLTFLPTRHARDSIAHYRRYLDRLGEAHPVLEWGLRWCEVHAPLHEETTVIHCDYRTGNYLVADGRLSGVLDWEFAARGNPVEDIGWLTAKCWRFGRPERTVGGVADADHFLEEYAMHTGRRPDAAALRYWQAMAHLRWAVIALQQRERHRSGIEPSLELALTGHIVSDLELEILALTGE